ncbi:Carbon monoxide dehydrogenase medium chain [Caenispirillum salinarum AK4]|uniref:Carbon monoxide dehydrogenase medium chain n=1 Tax=Caenispirillum salinarum AK4 TaxID=1238182 RepID=K9HU38_9PROT|nr:xanthine dehydrogenase family protein subunit M [Caenispirillum salinarum]EKV31756.1 Carbon monoxide dehydrogenase medium chain [Caenispirillum salinarum AK4]
MYQFEYQTPKSAADVVAALKADEDAKVVAGGMTLIPTLKQRLAMPTTLIDLRSVPELKGVREEGGTIVVGAMTTHAEVWADPTVKSKFPALSYLAGKIGDAQVRNRGTIGGSIANADPAADYPAAVLALNATIVTDSREIAADDMFTGLFETALNEGEIITEVRFPIAKRAGYAKFRHPASRYAIVGVMVAETDSGVRVGVTGAGPNAFRVPEMEQALASNFSPDAVANIKVPADDLNSDIHASAEYRAHLVTVMAKRAVEAAMG